MATIPLAKYLWSRIREVGVESLMGLPGDFNLNFLDYIYECDLKWTTNANELNAAYAADGYARVKNTPSCLVTTHGVGELSALNGIACAAAEHSPIIHVVGQTPRVAQDKHLMIHHSIGYYPDHQVYNKSSQFIRAAAAELWDPEKAPSEIDRVIRECVIQSKPVYIFFPIDLTLAEVPATPLSVKIDLSLPVNHQNEGIAVEAIVSALTKCKNPCIFVDFLVNSHGWREAKDLVEKAKLPVFSTHMARSIIDENHPCYVGIYHGQVSSPGVAAAIESMDFVLHLGDLNCDTNNGAFSRKLDPNRVIIVNDDHVMIQQTKLTGVYMRPLLARLNATLDPSKLPQPKIPTLPIEPAFDEDDAVEKITQTYLWRRIGRFVQPHDIVVADTGTASQGLPDATFPRDVRYLNSIYYGSIGWSLPAALGADLALRELHEKDAAKPRGRTLLLIGDGSMQLTLQEVGTLVKNGLKPIIFLVNNEGYTIERAIHGAHQQYNDIVPYNWSAMLSFFGAKNPDKCYRSVRTKAEFEAVCDDDDFKDPKQVQVVEIHVDMLDIPWRLASLLINRDHSMEQYFKDEGFTIGK